MQPNIIDVADIVIAGAGQGINNLLQFLFLHPILAAVVIVIVLVAVILYRFHRNMPHAVSESPADERGEGWRP